MVRKSAGKKTAEKATDLKADPGYADLYIPRKEGDPTGQSQMINDVLAPGLTTETTGPEAAATQQAASVQMGTPINIGAKTKYPNINVAEGLASSGNKTVTPKDPLNMEAYWMGLMEMFGEDPILTEYLTQDNAAPQIVNKEKQFKFGEIAREV
jgi:hypothetical protein